MGNESNAPILGRGLVRLEFSSNKIIELVDVLFVPQIRKNLVSGSTLNKLGYRQLFESEKFTLSKGGSFVGFGYLNNDMFMLSLNNKNFVSNSIYIANEVLVDSSLWHARLGHVNFKRMVEMSKDGLIPDFDVKTGKCKTCMLTKITRQPFPNVKRDSSVLELIHSDLCDLHSTPSFGNKKYVVTFIDDASRFCYIYLLHSKDEALDKFKFYKTEVELQMNGLIKCLRTDRGGEFYDPLFFQSVGIIHETTAPYTPQQNGVAERKNRVLKEMVNSMLSNSGLSDGFWGEAMLTACYLLNRVPNKRNKITPCELWFKKSPNLNYIRVWGCRAVVRLPEPKRKTLGEKGIECIFVGYAEHSKAYRFHVIEPNDSIAIHTVIESRDALFDETRFSSIPRPKDLVPNTSVTSEVEEQAIVPTESPMLRRSKIGRIEKSFGPDFQVYLVEGSRDEIGSQFSYCYSIEEDPKSFDEAMKSQDIAFWKEAINDEMDSIMGNNTWVLSDLPAGCKPLGCKWIFKRKMKSDGSIDKFKARLVIQGFRQREGIDYFDTYAPVARISTIRLLIALGAINNLVIHQMDVKTTFLNGDLEEEVYMKQPKGFIMPGMEHKVCKLVKSLYGLKQAPKQWHQKFDEVILSNGFLLNQADKCVYSKFDISGNGVIICLYVDDMLIFGTDQNQVDKTKEFLSSKFSMKDMGEAKVILGIRIKRENKGIAITQSHYIEKVLKKFNYFDCSLVSTPFDPSVKLMPNSGEAVSQLEYSKAIGCLMYAMTSTRPDIAFAVGKLSRYTSNPSIHHWQAIGRVFKYLKKTIDYGLSYIGFPSVLEGYSDASWITNLEDHSSTSGWVYLLGGRCHFMGFQEASLHHEFDYGVRICGISRCRATTLAKAYSQVYNGKSRHLGVIHSMIRELITNGVISIEFVWSQQNLADHLTKGLDRDLVHKSVHDERNYLYECERWVAKGLSDELGLGDFEMTSIDVGQLFKSHSFGDIGLTTDLASPQADMMANVMQMVTSAMKKHQEVFQKILEDRDASLRRHGAVEENVLTGSKGSGSRVRTEEHRVVGAPRGGMSCSHKSFLGCGPPEFSGSEDLVACVEWIRAVEQAFGSSECGDDQRVRFGTQQLRDTALMWWNVIQSTLSPTVLAQLTWGEFKVKLLEEYCNERAMDRMETEFQALEKGNLTVREYTRQFMEKLGLVGHVASTEKEKIKAYLKGLPSDMMTMVRNSKASNLRETIEETQFMEEVYARGKPEKAMAVVEKRKWESSSVPPKRT
ncbi:hypothetical protein L6452_27096 [Arctium lappa]|uniref:Uncharacterized protein n=1 Tax=Arctium lappa TaxID=4217 RepID=A0ACB8ZUU2_ARCLA|nr:hypothetical protein L6452_27096 [Arctium lappa]